MKVDSLNRIVLLLVGIGLAILGVWAIASGRQLLPTDVPSLPSPSALVGDLRRLWETPPGPSWSQPAVLAGVTLLGLVVVRPQLGRRRPPKVGLMTLAAGATGATSVHVERLAAAAARDCREIRGVVAARVRFTEENDPRVMVHLDIAIDASPHEVRAETQSALDRLQTVVGSPVAARLQLRFVDEQLPRVDAPGG